MPIKNIFFPVLLLGFSFVGCKKDPSLLPNISPIEPGLSSYNALTIIYRLINTNADFNIRVSSSIGNGLYEPTTLKNGTTLVEASTSYRTNVGELTVNNTAIPFANGLYFFQPDTSQTAAFLTGKINTYRLQSGSFPHFEFQDYAFTLPIVTFNGIVDYKLPLDTALTLNWNVDNDFPAGGKALALVSYEDDQSGITTTLHKEVNQASGRTTFTTAELRPFSDKPYLRVYFAKVSLTTKKVNNKTVAVKNLAFSYSRIYRAS